MEITKRTNSGLADRMESIGSKVLRRPHSS